jgi:ectoine hydroxylase-related dioxygenase (phytanoyl-CoA dioxygenase family)
MACLFTRRCWPPAAAPSHQPFKLSNLLGRTLRPKAQAQELHVDYARDGQDWPMVGFIVMIDEFRKENSATRFVPGSHLGSRGAANASGPEPEAVPACPAPPVR